ncbi:MAG: YeeE/YedE family protein [Candidatus Aminicenantes bacterium]|nr:YeeE/YedE family protein [Candidatus Aminicenantes bacterium]
MLNTLHQKKGWQLLLGFVAGVFFGFFLQKGGVTQYDIILGQLLLQDFTVVKIMLAAVVTGMLGVHLMRALGWVRLQPKPGSWATAVWGGLFFGIGFAVLGYCPGTVAGAVGNGFLDAAVGGLVGITVGAGLFAAVYGRIQKPVLSRGDFGEKTLPQLFKTKDWTVVLPAAVVLTAVLWLLERAGL